MSTTISEVTHKLSTYEEYIDRFSNLSLLLSSGVTRDIEDIIVQKSVQSSSPIDIVDMGYGNGQFLLGIQQVVPTSRLHGIDIQFDTQVVNTLLTSNKTTDAPVQLKQASIEQLADLYQPESFDIAVASNMFHVVEDPVDVFFRQGSEILKQNGLLLINSVNLDKYFIDPSSKKQFVAHTEQIGWIWSPRGFEGNVFDVAVTKHKDKPFTSIAVKLLQIQKNGRTVYSY
jgi:ubiquinone/menaquinone biosynthesis C-methylase UbiE